MKNSFETETQLLAITLSEDKDFELICISAVRYALGRRTYIVGVVCDFVKRYIKLLSDKSIYVLIADIEAYDKDIVFNGQSYNQLGDDCDARNWRCLKAFTIRELEERDKKI